MSQSWQSHGPPPGWQGQWPPPPNFQMPPGFPGPPPVPQNVPVPPSTWQAGYWQYNARVHNPGIQYPGSQPQPNAPPPWAPSNHWSAAQQQQQQSQGFNPYKKVPRPPEAGYYDYQLSDNPLGLEGMIPSSRNDPSREHGENEGGPQTPWIWNPPTLRESKERPIADRAFGSTSTEHTRIPPRRATTDSHVRDGVHAHGLAAQRSASDVTSQLRPGPPSQNPIFASSSGPLANIPGFVPNPQQVPNQPVAQNPVQESESFTEKKELHTVFSSNIIRTPDHYHRKNLEASRQANIYRPGGYSKMYIPRSKNAIDEMNGFVNPGPSVQPLERHSSLPSNLPSSSSSSSSASMFGLANYTEEPSSLLSPLIGATPKTITNPLDRARTDPSLTRSHTLNSIAESSASNQGDIGLAPLLPPKDDVPYVPLQSSRERHPTPHPRRENPLPPPPIETQRSSPSPHSRPPVHYSRKVRKGFWNRRGDHLTSDLHVVYAPPDKAYPAELASYPDGKEGYFDAYLNHHIPWIEDRPELSASLPQKGRPPTQPYESFVVYGYLP